jgi:hypothetical protein
MLQQRIDISQNIVEFQQFQKNRNTRRRCSSVLVQCDTIRCVAYQDPSGRWRNYFNDDELQGTIKEILPN